MNRHPRGYRYEDDDRPMTEAEYMREELLGAQWAEARWRAAGCADGFCGAMDCYTCRGDEAADYYGNEEEEEEEEEEQDEYHPMTPQASAVQVPTIAGGAQTKRAKSNTPSG